MKTIRIILILISFVAFSLAAAAQIKSANKMFSLYRYAEAIPLYIKAIEKEKAPELRLEATTRLADCYRFTNNVEKASEWYEKVVQAENIDPVNYLYYGQALQSKGQYENAKAAFLKYSHLVPADSRGSLLAASCEMPRKWENIPEEFEIKNIISINSKWSDFGPAYYKEGIVFTSDRMENLLESSTYGWTNNNYLDMYFVKQLNPQDPFGQLSEVTAFSKNLNKPYHDASATFSKDFSTIYFTRSFNDKTVEKDHIKTHLLKIFYAQAKGSGWSEEKPFFLNSEYYSVAHPSLSADGKTIFFSSDMPGGFGAFDIWSCKWEDDKWSAPVNAGKEINTFGNEAFPFVLNDSTLYFASNGLPGYGGLDVFVTTKKDGKWQMPRNLKKPVNSSYDDFSLVMDTSDLHGFFSSNRPGGLGSDDIYACNRLPVTPDVKTEKPADITVTPVAIAHTPLTPEPYFVSGFVKDKNSMLPVQGASVYLLNIKTGLVKVLVTNNEGYYKSALNKGERYVVKAVKLNYLPDCLNLMPELSDTADSLKAPYDLMLDKLDVGKIFNLQIYYDVAKWYIRTDAKQELDKLVKIMKESNISVELGSHTDSRGSAVYNEALSQKRAEEAVNYIIQNGIDKSRITAKGYGERKLVNKCADGVNCTPEEHQANRRTEFKITSVMSEANQKANQISNLKAGDEIDRSAFTPDFFENCTLK